MKNYFDFMIYMAFEAILYYEDKRSLTLSQLHDFRLKLCEKHIERSSKHAKFDQVANVENLQKFEEARRSFHSLNINMTSSEELQNFRDFINDHGDLFYYTDGKIHLKDDVSSTEIEKAKFELDSYRDAVDITICGELISIIAWDNIECLDVLGIAKKVKSLVYEIVRDEKVIERAYQNLPLQEKIENLAKFVDFRLAVIGNLKEDKMGCYHRVMRSAQASDPEVSGDSSGLLSESLTECDPFYDFYAFWIDSSLNNPFQRAIFNTGALAYDRLLKNMDMLWQCRDSVKTLENEFDEEEFEDDDDEDDEEEFEDEDDDEEFKDEADDEKFKDEFDDIDDCDVESVYDDEDDMDEIEYYLHDKKIYMTFYLNYIRHIDWYQESISPDMVLEQSRRRLLYILDSYGDNLYQEDNLKRALANTLTEGMNYREDFKDFYMMSRVFLVDILEGWADDDRTLRKMLFASTYYDLTGDKRIENILNKYQQTTTGEKVSGFILNHNYAACNFSSDSAKKMIKTNPDDAHGKKDGV